MANDFLKLLPNEKKNAPTGEAHSSCRPRRARISVVPWNTGLEAFDPQLTILGLPRFRGQPKHVVDA